MTSPVPPSKDLSASAKAMWQRLAKEYRIVDGAGLALLRSACESFDRAQQAREAIKNEGILVVTKTGSRAHPACKIEHDARGAMHAALRALNLHPGVADQ